METPRLAAANSSANNNESGSWLQGAKDFLRESPFLQRLGGAAVGTLESNIPGGFISGYIPGPTKEFEEGRAVAHIAFGIKQFIEGVQTGLVGVAGSETGVGVVVAGAGLATTVQGVGNIVGGLGILDRAFSMKDPESEGGATSKESTPGSVPRKPPMVTPMDE